MIRLLLVSTIAAALAACASAPEDVPAKGPALPVAGTDVTPAGGLPAQHLAPGACGLFLWRAAAPREFIFFTTDSGTGTLAYIDGKSQALTATGAGGDVFGQFLTEMEYSVSGTGLIARTSITPGEVIEGGQRIDSGNLTVVDAEGWETIVPVTGARACMPG